MCEDTVFWDLNYAIKYKALGTDDVRTKVLKVMLYEQHQQQTCTKIFIYMTDDGGPRGAII